MLRLARKSKLENLHFNYSNFYITVDYAQNLPLPHFGNKQPGDTYYYSLLGMHVFSLVDHWALKDYLYTFIYYKSEGKKGWNNVASMLYYYIIHYSTNSCLVSITVCIII